MNYRSASARIVRAWLDRLAANVDLTWDEALQTLGFAAGSSPSKEDVQRAYRMMARKYHPDLGGDAEKMVEVNAAKDILDGTRQPSRGYNRYTPPKPAQPKPEPRQPRYEQPRYEAPKNTGWNRKVVVSLSEALHDVSIPAGVRWLCITEEMRSSRNYFGDESSRYSRGYIALGQTDTQMVLLLMHHVSVSRSYLGGEGDSDTWECVVQTATLKNGELNPAAATKAIKALMAQANLDKPANPKVTLLAEKWTPSETSLPKGGSEIRLSEFFVNLGLKKAPNPAKAAPKKLQIDIAVSSDSRIQDAAGIFVGDTFYRVRQESGGAALKLYWSIYASASKNNYPDKGYYRKSLTRVVDRKRLAAALLSANVNSYISPSLPDDVIEAIKVISEK